MKDVDGVGLAVCHGDRCIPLSIGGSSAIETVEGVAHVYAVHLTAALSLELTQSGGLYIVTRANGVVGVAAGNRAPAFTLPDLNTGEPVSSTDYAGRKVVFYIWASW